MTLPRKPRAQQDFQLGVCSQLLWGCMLLIMLSGCQSNSEPQKPSAIVVGPQYASNQTSPNELIQRRSLSLPDESPTSKLAATGAPWLTTIQADFVVARHLVEQELQADLGAIQLQLVDDNPINEEVAIETQRLIHKQFGASDFATHFLAQVMHPLAGTYAALYSSRLGAVMISRNMLASYESSLNGAYDEPAKRAALLTLLIHELVHAADDQRYKIHDNRALNFRASFAQSATFEGHAQWVTRRICKTAGCSAGLRALDDFMFSVDKSDSHDKQPLEAISRSVLEYSYIEGERFVEGLAQRENGAQLIDQLLRTPPLDPIQILVPENFPDTAREYRNQTLIKASRPMAHPWASAPWIGVETSPLKGVDLRSDPTRRQAAVDGFTRLIQGMISMQFYDQTLPSALPVEATVLQAESINTAKLFASTLHTNTQHSGARIDDETLLIKAPLHSFGTVHPGALRPAVPPINIHIYRTTLDTDAPFRTAIAVAGLHVVQVSGSAVEQSMLDDYAIRVLVNLNGPESAASDAKPL